MQQSNGPNREAGRTFWDLPVWIIVVCLIVLAAMTGLSYRGTHPGEYVVVLGVELFRKPLGADPTRKKQPAGITLFCKKYGLWMNSPCRFSMVKPK